MVKNVLGIAPYGAELNTDKKQAVHRIIRCTALKTLSSFQINRPRIS